MPARPRKLVEVVPVVGSERPAWATSASLSAGSAALWTVTVACPWSVTLGIALVAYTAIASVLVAMVAPSERRVLAVALVIVLPIVGPLAAASAIAARGQDGTALLHDPVAAAPRIDGAALAKTLTRALPPCEALISHDVDLRRATIARLASRASAEDVSLLRWARTRKDPELAVEIALALEDIDQRFERQLREARANAEARPREVFELIANALQARIVDVPLVEKLACEARTHYDAAIALEPERARDLLATRARLELAVRRHDLVVPLLQDAVTENPNGELATLYAEALYALRAFGVIAALEARMSPRAA
jgi:hypothetical protein